MWTGKNENEEYTAQIAPYHGKVHAEIIKRNPDTGGREGDLWLTIMDKSFGKSRNSTPREEDYVAANKWVEEQLVLINKHATTLVTTPKFLRDINRGMRTDLTLES
jgi:hypothetical protein